MTSRSERGRRAKARGLAAERRCVEWLTQPWGTGGPCYDFAVHTPGSLGDVDVIALAVPETGPVRVVLIMVRSGKRPRHSPAERRDALVLGRRLRVPVMEWLEKTHGRGRPAEITWRRVEE